MTKIGHFRILEHPEWASQVMRQLCMPLPTYVVMMPDFIWKCPERTYKTIFTKLIEFSKSRMPKFHSGGE